MPKNFVLLNMPKVSRTPFERHFLSQVAAELRFNSTEIDFKAISAKPSLTKVLAGFKATDVFEWKVNLKKGTEPEHNSSIVGKRWESTELGKVVQVQTDRFIYVQKNYVSFEEFFANFCQIWGEFESTFAKFSLQRIGLRKIDSVLLSTETALSDGLSLFNERLFGSARANLTPGSANLITNDLIQGTSESQQLTIRSTIRTKLDGTQSRSGYEFVLDFDLAFQDLGPLPTAEIEEHFTELNEAHFKVFLWAITKEMVKKLNKKGAV